MSCFIELPSVDSYKNLEIHSSFEPIKRQFLSDIQKLKVLSHNYVGQQYDDAINVFHDNLNRPIDGIKEHIFALYHETRYQIHQLVLQLKNNNSADNKDYIASILHDCLDDIDLCPAGVHSRFARSFLNLQLLGEGWSGKLYKVRHDLFSEFIHSFLFKLTRENVIDVPVEMKIHWFNGCYNLYCEPLALTPIEDPLAPSNLSDRFVEHFLSAASISVNACTILRRLSSQWSDQLTNTLQQLGVSAWESDSIAPSEMTVDIIGELDSEVFKPINYLLKTTENESFNLWSIIEENDDGTYQLKHYKEKILAWATNYFYGSKGKVFAAIPCQENSKVYIGTINHVYFWVFSDEQFLQLGQPCFFQYDKCQSIQLSHLTAVDFTTWPEASCYALLTQAMEQTDEVDDIVSFLLHPKISRQLAKMPEPIIESLSNQLAEKRVGDNGNFEKTFCESVCDYLIITLPTKFALPIETPMLWLVYSPFLESILERLYQFGVNISSVTSCLNSWQISNFSEKNIKKLLTHDDCERLFEQAVSLQQVETMASLLLTGHCDYLIGLRNDNGETPLAIFARLGVLSGLKYVVRFTTIQVNNRDNYGWTPLCCAAYEGHWQCVQELLNVPTIMVNIKNKNGSTPLICAAKKGHWKCVRVLLKSPTILVNEKTGSNRTALSYAAQNGHLECIRELLKKSSILVNEKSDRAITALSYAAKNGHWRCVRELVGVPGIEVNDRCEYGRTPISYAAKNGHWECIRELGKVMDIEINERSINGWTPLNSAARHGHVKCIRELLKLRNIDVNVTNGNGWTSLNIAAAEGHSECIQELLKSPHIDVNATNNLGYTPLNSATKVGHVESIQALLKAANVKINEANNQGYTPLCSAVSEGYVSCVKKLLVAHSELDEGCPEQLELALMLSIKHGQEMCAKLLIWHIYDNGIELSLDNALAEAKTKKMTEVVALLEDHLFNLIRL